MSEEFRYAVEFRATGPRPGAHRSNGGGSGFEFRDRVPLMQDPDPRRLDMHASCSQPNGELMVRVFRQRRAISVWILADLSASMGFDGVRRKCDVLADFTAAAARSAHRTGDAFGFLGASDALIGGFCVAPTRARGCGELLAQRLRRHVPTGSSVAGLAPAANRLGRHRALVFLVSDFHWPASQLKGVLDALARHWVVPVVLWDPAEFTTDGHLRIETLRDLESGRRRMLLLRPALCEKIRAAFGARQRALCESFHRHGMRPLFLLDGYDSARVSRYFIDRHAAPDISG